MTPEELSEQRTRMIEAMRADLDAFRRLVAGDPNRRLTPGQHLQVATAWLWRIAALLKSIGD